MKPVLALLAALLLAGCARGPAVAPVRPLQAPTAQAATRAALGGTLGDQAVAIRIADGAIRVTLGDASFAGTHSLFAVDGTLTAPGRADRALAVRMAGGKLVGEIDGVPLTLTVKRDAANQQRLLEGVWGDRRFDLGFKTAPDARLQLRFEGAIGGQPAAIQGSGPWQGEQFAVYTSLFALLAAAP